jgi:D-serine deaminase-like pyridoxal phosphate-dependent protein
MPLGPNGDLRGRPGSRRHLNTPALLIDLDAFEHNIATMAAQAKRAGLGLRPHAKAHKSLAVARRQLAAGALGVSCATLGEAEVMAGAALPGILITSPVVTAPMIARLAALLAASADVTVVADHPANVAALEAAAAAAGRRLPVIVDFDVGQHRTGAASEAAAVTLARQIAASPHLGYAGLQAYYGHLQQVPAAADRQAAAAAQQARVRSLCRALAEAGLPPAIVAGGGTGTAFADLGAETFTELQPGSYLFLDSCYGAIPLAADGSAPFRPSLFVQASIVSVNQPGLAVCNAGLKSFATDSGKPKPVAGAPAGAAYRFMGDEHGGIEFPAASADAPALGAAVELLTSHCDPTVNLHDWLHCVRGDVLVDIWPVDARGR